MADDHDFGGFAAPSGPPTTRPLDQAWPQPPAPADFGGFDPPSAPPPPPPNDQSWPQSPVLDPGLAPHGSGSNRGLVYLAVVAAVVVVVAAVTLALAAGDEADFAVGAAIISLFASCVGAGLFALMSQRAALIAFSVTAGFSVLFFGVGLLGERNEATIDQAEANAAN